MTDSRTLVGGIGAGATGTAAVGTARGNLLATGTVPTGTPANGAEISGVTWSVESTAPARFTASSLQLIDDNYTGGGAKQDAWPESVYSLWFVPVVNDIEIDAVLVPLSGLESTLTYRLWLADDDWITLRRRPLSTSGTDYTLIGANEPVAANTVVRVYEAVSGARGNTGPRGLQGNPGPQGDDGSRGPQGNEGPQGNPGPQGDEGPRGATGERGPQGVQGIQGVAGPSGDASVDNLLTNPEVNLHLPFEFIVGQRGQRPFAITLVAGTNSMNFFQPPEGTAVGTIVPANTHVLNLSYYESDYGVPALNGTWRVTVADGVALTTLVIDGHELALTEQLLTPHGNRHWQTAANAYTPSAGDLTFNVRLVQSDGRDLGAVETWATLPHSDLGGAAGSHADNIDGIIAGIEAKDGDADALDRGTLQGDVQPEEGLDASGRDFALRLYDLGEFPTLYVRDRTVVTSISHRNRFTITLSESSGEYGWEIGDAASHNHDNAVGYFHVNDGDDGDATTSNIELDLRDDLSGLPARGESIWLQFVQPNTLPTSIRDFRIEFYYGYDTPTSLRTYNGITYRRYRHENAAAAANLWNGTLSADLFTSETGSTEINFHASTESTGGEYIPIGSYHGEWNAGYAYPKGCIVDFSGHLYMRAGNNIARSTTTPHASPVADTGWIRLGISGGDNTTGGTIVDQLSHLPPGSRLNRHFVDGTSNVEVGTAEPSSTTGYQPGDLYIEQASTSSEASLWVLKASYNQAITNRGRVDVTLDAQGVYDPAHGRGTTTDNYNRFVDKIIVHINPDGTTYTFMLAVNQTALLSANSNNTPNNLWLDMRSPSPVSLTGGFGVESSLLGFENGVTVQTYRKTDLSAAQYNALLSSQILFDIRNGNSISANVLNIKPASRTIPSAWQELIAATEGGSGAVGSGEQDGNPLAAGIVAYENLDPILQSALNPRYEINAQSSNLSIALLGWFGSELTGFELRNDVPFLPAAASKITSVTYPEIHQASTESADYRRYIEFPSDMTAAHGFEIGGLHPLENTGDSVCIYLTVHPYQLPSAGVFTLLSFAQVTGRDWNLRVDNSGNLILYDGTNSTTIAAALSTNNTARIRVQLVRLADLPGGNQQYRGYLQVGSAASSNVLDSLGVTATGNVLDSAPTVVIGNANSNPSLAQSFRGWMADIIVAHVTGSLEAPAPGAPSTVNREAPYGTLFTLSINTSPTSVVQLTPGPNLLGGEVAIPNLQPFAPISVDLGNGVVPGALLGFWLHLRLEAEYTVRVWMDIANLPIRTAADATNIADHRQGYIFEANGFTGAGQGTAPNTGGTFNNLFFLSLVGDISLVRRLMIWASSIARGVTPALLGIYAVYRRRH